MLCCRKGPSSSHEFCFTFTADGELFNLLTLSLGEVGSRESAWAGMRGVERVEREPSLGIIRKISMEFLFYVWKLTG